MTQFVMWTNLCGAAANAGLYAGEGRPYNAACFVLSLGVFLFLALLETRR